MNYIIKSTSTKKSQIIEKNFSLSGKDYRVLKTNTNTKPISDFIKKSYTGKEIGSEAYMKNSKHRFLKTFNIGKNFCLEISKFEYCKPINKVFPQKGDILISKDGGGDGLGESVIYNLDNKSKKDSISSGILGITLNEEYKFYIFGFIKSKHFKNFIDLNTAQGSTIRHSKKVALDYKVPFPTLENNVNTDNIEKYISIIVQNIVDKEEKIKIKNKVIDEAIETELNENQKEISFNYTYPKINEVSQKNYRIDSGLYENNVKKTENKIKNYKNGFFNISEHFKYCRGQNLQVSQIGESYYSDEPKNNFYRMFTNVEMQDDRTISGFRYLGNKNELTTLPKNGILFAADGMIVGRSFFYDEMPNTITNIHPWVITAIDEEFPIYKRVFLSVFLSYLKNIDFLEKIKDKSNGGGLKKGHLDNWIIVPKFPDKKQEEIAKLYYNKIDKNIDVNLENYLEKEIKRNELLGIFQLNMEIFELREKLENIIHKIVIEEKIEIDLKY